MDCSLSARTASLSLSPVLGQSKVYVRSDGSSIFGRSAEAAEADADAVGDADVSPVSAPAILSLSFDSPSPPPQAVSSRAADATSAAATGKERRFTVDSP